MPGRFPAEKIREQSARSRQLEDREYGSSAGDYDRAFAEGRQYFELAFRFTDGFRRLSSDTLGQDERIISILRHALKPYMAADRLGQLSGLPRGRIQAIEGGSPADREELTAIGEVVTRYLDRDRFPWLASPLDSSEMRTAQEWAARWTSSHYANVRSRTRQRMAASEVQEDAVARAFVAAGWALQEDAVSIVRNANDILLGCFTRERRIQCRPPPNKKADHVLRLDTTRLLLIEAKHNIDELNARKRIAEIRDKATKWRQSLGQSLVVVGAVLSGYFPEDEVRSLWEDGILIFWQHDLGELTGWVRNNGSRA